MKVREVIKYVREEMGKDVVDIEVYKYTGIGVPHYHGDYVEGMDIDDVRDIEAREFEVMNQEEYDRTLLANCCVSADFAEWYDDKDARVLAILI